jgi:DNA-binding XRE family transcriptional regulator
MVIEAPVTIPGPKLRAQREGYGITRKALAARLQHHRNTILAWENDPSVDVRRQRLYLAALRELVEEQA